MVAVDSGRVIALRDLLAGTGWVERTRDFATTLRRTSTTPGGLLLVGTPQDEPWHLAAHLDDESRLTSTPSLSPTLVRWSAPPDAPPHLSFTLARLEAARRDETVFIVAPSVAPESLLERIADARRVGATILSIDDGDDELGALTHDRLVVPSDTELLSQTGPGPALNIDVLQHMVSIAAGEDPSRRVARSRLSRFLDRVSGPAPRH